MDSTRRAIIVKSESISHQELDCSINQCANYLVNQKIGLGTIVALIEKPSISLAIIQFALEKIGASTIYIDPSTDKTELRNAIKDMAPQAIICTSSIRALSKIFKADFSSVGTIIDISKLRKRIAKYSGSFSPQAVGQDSITQIVRYSNPVHGKPFSPREAVSLSKANLESQLENFRELFSLSTEDTALACSAEYFLICTQIGMTTLLPGFNLSKPSDINPKELTQLLRDEKVNFAVGPAFIWTTIANYCMSHEIRLPKLKRLVFTDPETPRIVHEKWENIIPNGTSYNLYSSPIATPLSAISYADINTLDTDVEKYTSPAIDSANSSPITTGICVGKPVPGIDLRIAEDNSIVVRGKSVSTANYSPSAESCEQSGGANIEEVNLHSNSFAKARTSLEIDGQTYQSTGDVGRIDEHGRVWVFGRSDQVIDYDGTKIYPESIEALFNDVDRVERCALVGPVIGGRVCLSLIIELSDGRTAMTKTLLADLKDMQEKYADARRVERFYIIEAMPTLDKNGLLVDKQSLNKWVDRYHGRYFS